MSRAATPITELQRNVLESQMQQMTMQTDMMSLQRDTMRKVQLIFKNLFKELF